MSLTGFDPAELDDLFKADIKDGVHDDDFDVDAELKKPVFSKAGDVWQLGIHRLLCGDSTQPETYQRLLQGTPVNLVVTDPPYNVNYEGRAKKLGRIREPKKVYPVLYPTTFSLAEKTQTYTDPFQQAEYAYSLIESEESIHGITDAECHNHSGTNISTPKPY